LHVRTPEKVVRAFLLDSHPLCKTQRIKLKHKLRLTVNKPMKALFIVLITLTLSCNKGDKHTARGFIVLSPEVAEIICTLGAEDMIIGVTEECNYPAALASKRKVGNFSTINKEAIICLNPSIVFCSALEQEGMAVELKKLGLRVEVVYPASLQELNEAISKIGSLIGKQHEAKALNQSMQEQIVQLKGNAEGKTKPKVYLEIYRNPLMSVADSSFVGELIETAGGDNIFNALERDYARVNPEAVINSKPDIMICFSQDSLESIMSPNGWQDIPAIRTGRIYFEKDINPDLLQRAAPRCLEGMTKLQTIYDNWRLVNEK